MDSAKNVGIRLSLLDTKNRARQDSCSLALAYFTEVEISMRLWSMWRRRKFHQEKRFSESQDSLQRAPRVR